MSFLLVNSSGSKAVSETPTAGLRWKEGVLQQCWNVVTYDCGKIDEQKMEWRDVPQAEE